MHLIHLTPKQQKVLDFISSRIQKDLLPPTIREIAQSLSFSSTGTVRDYLGALEKKGYLKRTRNKSRSIGLLRGPSAKIAILADIPAGKSGLAYEDIQGYIDTHDLFLGQISRKDVFALKVKGESMSEAGIIEGDIAVIKKQPTASNNDIIAALIENSEVTLKRLRQKGNSFFLEPANKNYQPIFKDFTVIGKLISIIRKY